MSARPHARDCTAVFPRTSTAHEIDSEPCYAPLEECSDRLSYPTPYGVRAGLEPATSPHCRWRTPGLPVISQSKIGVAQVGVEPTNLRT